MAQKTKPTAIRVGITKPWTSRWFFKKSLNYFLEEDECIRTFLKKKILQAGIASIEIDRTADMLRVSVKAARPGLIIGRGGKGIEDLKSELLRKIKALRTKKEIETKKWNLSINIEELKRNELSAQVMAQQIAFDMERRMPYRRIMKKAIENAKQNHEVKGVKVKIGGRLDGAEISRSDQLSWGKMPLQSFRANIDYGEAPSFNSYGTVGVKVWLYKGDIFEEEK
jgi:small subunit ribosomal protein S3